MSALQELFRSHKNNVSDLREAQKQTAHDLGKWLDDGKVKPEQLSIREMFETFVAPQIEANGKKFDLRTSDFAEVREEMVSSMFPYATGKLIHPAIIEQYEVDLANIRQLVREVKSDRRVEDIVGFSDGDRPRHVEEGQPYPEAQMTEKRAQITNHKFGQGMGLTVEMVRFDQTDEVINRAKDTGTFIADLLEEFICYRLADTAWSELQEGSTSQAFIYGGTQAAIYSNDHSAVDTQTNDNLVAAAAPSIASALTMTQALAAMKTEKGRPARVRPRIVFGHTQSADTLHRFFNEQDFNPGSANLDVNIYKGVYQIVTSQFFPSTTNWFMGDPAKQFRLQWVWEPNTNVVAGDPKRDILTSFYTSMYCGVGATDYRHVAKNPV
jgi:hypothetical protein